MSTTNREEFRAFGSYGASQSTGGSWDLSLAASSVIYLVIGLLVMSIPVTKHIIQSKPIQLTFTGKGVRPPPPLPPPGPIAHLTAGAPSPATQAAAGGAGGGIGPDHPPRPEDPAPRQAAAPEEVRSAQGDAEGDPEGGRRGARQGDRRVRRHHQGRQRRARGRGQRRRGRRSGGRGRGRRHRLARGRGAASAEDHQPEARVSAGGQGGRS